MAFSSFVWKYLVGFLNVVERTEEALNLKGAPQPLYIRSWSPTFISSDPHVSPASHIFPHSLMDPNVATIIPYIPYIQFHPIYPVCPVCPICPIYPISSHISPSHISCMPNIPKIPHGSKCDHHRLPRHCSPPQNSSGTPDYHGAPHTHVKHLMRHLNVSSEAYLFRAF